MSTEDDTLSFNNIVTRQENRDVENYLQAKAVKDSKSESRKSNLTSADTFQTNAKLQENTQHDILASNPIDPLRSLVKGQLNGKNLDIITSNPRHFLTKSSTKMASTTTGLRNYIWLLMPFILAQSFAFENAGQGAFHAEADHAFLICHLCFALGFQASKHFNDGALSSADVSRSHSSHRIALKESFDINVESESTLSLRRKTPGFNRFGLNFRPESKKATGSNKQQEVAIDLTVQELPYALIQSPLKTFPKDGDPHKDLNCISVAYGSDFPVRGKNYLVDRKKIRSSPMLFPSRGADLFLTDECPENIGRYVAHSWLAHSSPHHLPYINRYCSSNPAILGGKLREKPTFLINFRLHWGNLILYYEIPQMFLPYVQKRYDPQWADKDVPPIDHLSPAERCTARFLMGDDEHKKQTLKILPKVLSGPWIVKRVVRTKPAIIGNKLPVTYHYQPPEGEDKQLYLEVDLDIVASATARKILGVVRHYTQSLTLALGFVVEGKLSDELPEQMMVGTRLHGLDPPNSSVLPPMP